MPLISKMIALWLVIETLLIIGCLIGIITQILHGFGDIRLGVYLIQMIVISGLSFLSLIALSVFIHILVNNKYLGYFILLLSSLQIILFGLL
ncbi:MAG: hypothetical protein IPJ26_15550 [Bacteroidetes bacterium]|nr:hypothetical protein [Bacteroidota bacterium]